MKPLKLYGRKYCSGFWKNVLVKKFKSDSKIDYGWYQ